MLHSPQQARELGLGLKGADAGMHGQVELVYELVYKRSIDLAVMTFFGKQMLASPGVV